MHPVRTLHRTEQKMETNQIRPRTVSLISKLLRPLADEGVMTVPEMRQIVSNLRHLASRGTAIPVVEPKLITQEAAAEMLGIGYSNLKKLFKEGRLPIKRKRIGSAVRLLNTDVLAFMLSADEENE
jgi:hypothetical protein